MMGQAAASAAPAHAVKCWVDGLNLYFELPGLHGPTVIAFTRDSIGFSKAMATLFLAAEGHGEPYHRPQLSSSIPDKNGITPAQRQDARDILKRLKII